VLSFGVTVAPDPPWQRLVELMCAAEANGFDYGWTHDSHIKWQDPYPLLTAVALSTERLKLGLNVTNPLTREPSVTASAFATLQDMTGGRMVMGIARGDSALRMIGLEPTPLAEFERVLPVIRDLVNGRRAEWNGTEVELEWAKGRPEVPLYVAGYGPKVLAVAARQADGVIIQAADPDIVEWIVGQVRQAAEAAGRDPRELGFIACAPAVVDDDVSAARDVVRWFPGVVGRYAQAVVRQADPATLPRALTALAGASERDVASDEAVDRLCLVGPPEVHVAKLRRLAELGVGQFNVYLDAGQGRRTLDAYGKEVIPRASTP
jgi:probable F420-dependent oxidoreductase